MRLPVQHLAACLLPLLVSACAWLPNANDGWEAVSPAVHVRRLTPFADSVFHVARIDLTSPDVAIVLTPETEAGRTIDRFAGYDDALVAVNASFFGKTFIPRGATRSSGTAWQLTSTPDELPVLACAGARACRILAVPPAANDTAWHTVVAGIPDLLIDGNESRARLCAPRQAFCDNPHPRTALGLDADGRTLWIVVAEGRHGNVAGVSLAQLTAVLRDLGATQALNLDGGGSTTFSVRGEQRAVRPDNERELRVIGNALLVVSSRAEAPAPARTSLQ